MQSQISWLLQKPTDLDLHCLQRQGISGFSRTRVNLIPSLIWHYGESKKCSLSDYKSRSDYNIWCDLIKVYSTCKIFASGRKKTLSLLQRILLTLSILDPVVQSVVSLTSSLVVKILTVLVSTISNSQVFLLQKCE